MAVWSYAQLLYHAPGALLDGEKDRLVTPGEQFACRLVEYDLERKDRESARHPGEVFVPGHFGARGGAQEYRNLRLKVIAAK